jgi:hypothetical protein
MAGWMDGWMDSKYSTLFKKIMIAYGENLTKHINTELIWLRIWTSGGLL